MRILITGPRTWSNRRLLYEVFASLNREFGPDITIVHGGAGGLDIMAVSMAKLWHWDTESHYPDYERYLSRVAPLMRNQEMVDSGVDLCLVFLTECPIKTCKRPKPHYTHGTTDCMERAMKAGIPVRKYET